MIADRILETLGDDDDLGVHGGTSWLLLQRFATPHPEVRARDLRGVVRTPVVVGESKVTVDATVAWVWVREPGDPVQRVELALLASSYDAPADLPRLEPA